jgi:NAD+ synthase (glutamine-hydrolysing)
MSDNRLVRIGIANVNTTVGDFRGNMVRAFGFARQSMKNPCDIVVFPEMTIPGYPPEDLVQWDGFIEGQWQELQKFVTLTGQLPYRTVYAIGVVVPYLGTLYNCAAIVAGGKILGLVPKEKLPTYGEFYEGRTLGLGYQDLTGEFRGVPFGDLIFDCGFATIGCEICEDLWSGDGPMKRRAYSGAEIILNLSASPYRAGVVGTRSEMIPTRAGDNQVVLVYANLIGGNGALVFDGGGFINQNGVMLATAERWKETLTTAIVDLSQTTRRRFQNSTWRSDQRLWLQHNQATRKILWQEPLGVREPLCMRISTSFSYLMPKPRVMGDIRDTYFRDQIEVCKLGLRDYFEKTKAFKRIIIALSGGKDSMITLVFAYMVALTKFGHLPEEERKAAIKDFIWCISMPTKFNTTTTRRLSADICERFGVTFKEISIQDAVELEVAKITALLPEGYDTNPETNPAWDLTLQNAQARVRGEIMQNLANAVGGFWLQTSNMSEKAQGYTTVGGDMMGGYSLIANMAKTNVIALLEYLRDNYVGYEFLEKLLATVASAELKDNQADEKDLMPFEIIDACTVLFVGHKLMPVEIHERLCWQFEAKYGRQQLSFWVRRFIRNFFKSIFKWVQCPESVHQGTVDLERERMLQIPVVQSIQWVQGDLDRLEALEKN